MLVWKLLKMTFRKVAQRARDIINNHERRVVRDLECHKSKALSKVESIVQALENRKAKALTFEQEAKNLCQLGKAVDLVERTPALQEQFNGRSMSKIENMNWVYHVDSKQSTEKSLTTRLASVKLNVTPVVTPVVNYDRRACAPSHT